MTNTVETNAMQSTRRQVKTAPNPLPYIMVAFILIVSITSCISRQSATVTKAYQSLTVLNKCKYGFDKPEYVNPRIIRTLAGGDWLSDPTTMVSIDLEANSSNQYYGEFAPKEINNERWIWADDPEGETLNPVWCAYRYLGVSQSEVHILQVMHCTGGTGVWGSILFVVFSQDETRGYYAGAKHQRDLITYVDLIILGDRYEGQISFCDGILRIGPDESEKRWGGRIHATEIVIQ